MSARVTEHMILEQSRFSLFVIGSAGSGVSTLSALLGESRYEDSRGFAWLQLDDALPESIDQAFMAMASGGALIEARAGALERIAAWIEASHAAELSEGEARLVVVTTAARKSIEFADRAIASLRGAFQRVFVIANGREGRVQDRDLEPFVRAGAKCVRVNACEANGLQRLVSKGLSPARGAAILRLEGFERGNERLAALLGLRVEANPGLDSAAVEYWTLTLAVWTWAEETLAKLSSDGLLDDVGVGKILSRKGNVPLPRRGGLER